MDGDRTPGLAPPPGITPNFVNPPSIHLEASITLVICLAITTPLVWLRLYTRLYIMKSRGLDDCKLRTCPTLNLQCKFIADLLQLDCCFLAWVSALYQVQERR